MPLLPAKYLVEVPPGSVGEFETPDGIYAICNVSGTIHCVDGICPHAGGPLGQGGLEGSTLICPLHGWEFDVVTGEAKVGGDCKLRTYPTVVKDRRIYVELP